MCMEDIKLGRKTVPNLIDHPGGGVVELPASPRRVGFYLVNTAGGNWRVNLGPDSSTGQLLYFGPGRDPQSFFRVETHGDLVRQRITVTVPAGSSTIVELNLTGEREVD